MDSGPSQSQNYSKLWLSIKDQVSKLESRGLVINNRSKAEDFLSHLNYYRFSGYCLPFEKTRHVFREGTTFEDIESAYHFDVNLRDLLTEALEVIEVDSRSKIAHIFGRSNGAFGHLDSSLFKQQFQHEDWLDRVREESQRSRELFVDHFSKNYTEFPDLPIWIATEVMPFGTVSKMYGELNDKYQKPISDSYNLQKGDLKSFLHHLSYVRNVCAHHSRIWDREWKIAPRLPAGKKWSSPLVPNNKQVFVTLLIIYRLLKKCSASRQFTAKWRQRINEIMKNPPPIASALDNMGMPAEWYKHPFWV